MNKSTRQWTAAIVMIIAILMFFAALVLAARLIVEMVVS